MSSSNSSATTLAKPSYTSMRGLQTFIMDIRQCKSKEAEHKRISKELSHILQKFKELRKIKNPKEEGYQRKKYVCKLVCIHLLGAEVDFGYLEAVELVGSPRLSEKHMGYLACTVLNPVDEDNEGLLITKLKADITSSKPMASALALDCIGCLVNRKITESCAAAVMQVLLGRSPVSAQKKAALVLLRLYRQSESEAMVAAMVNKSAGKIIALLEHRDMGVVTAVAQLLTVIASETPEPYEGCVEKAISALTSIGSVSISGSAYGYKGMVAPWTVVKLLQLLQCFPLPSSSTLKDRIKSVLSPIMRDSRNGKEKGDRKKSSINTLNARNMVLFEALNLVINYELDTRELFVEAVSTVGQFISSKEVNFRYLGLATMSELAKSDITRVALARHEDAIFKSLKDKDVSIRQRSLNLLYNMCNEENCERIVKELLQYLVTADYGIREELVLVIAILAEIPFNKLADKDTADHDAVAAAEKWYVDVVLKLTNIAGDYVSMEVWYRVLHIIVSTEHDAIQDYATKVVFDMLKEPTCHEIAIKIGGYVLGEFGHLIANDADSLPEYQFQVLWHHYPYVSNSTRSLLLTSFIKLRNLFAEIKPMVDTVLRNTRQAANADPEIQQRAIEYLHLSSKASDLLLEKVLDEMPAFTKSEIKSSKLVQLLDKKTGYGEQAKKRQKRRGAHTVSTEGANGQATAPLAAEAAKKAAEMKGASTSALVDVDSPADNIFTAPAHKVAAGGQGASSVVVRTTENDESVTERCRLFATSPSGVLYEDELVQVGVKTQWKGSKGKIELFIGNKSGSHSLDNTRIDVSPVSGLSVTPYVKGIAPKLAAKSQTPVAFLVGSTDYFAPAPAMELSFCLNRTVYHYTLRFPVYLSNFCNGVGLAKDVFIAKWQQLSAHQLEAKQVVAAKKEVGTAAMRNVLTSLNMQVLEGVEPNPANAVAATVMTTDAGPVGILVRIEPNAGSRMYRITVRSSKESVSTSIVDMVSWFL